MSQNNKQNIQGKFNAQADNNSVANVIVYQLEEHQITLEEIEEGIKRFRCIPVDNLPPYAPLPPRSRMFLRINPLFTGRNDQLLSLADLLKENINDDKLNNNKIVAIVGIGGSGKTQFTVEFVHRYAQFFTGGIFWLSFADNQVVLSQIALCGGAGYLSLRPDFAQLSLNEQIRLVYSAWESPMPRLLIFDNCETLDLLQQWLPITGGCRVIITSRRTNWDITMGIKVFSLNVLRRNESIALLQRYIPNITGNYETLGSICDELGDLPLALHLAGSYLKKYHRVITVEQYLRQLKSSSILGHSSLQLNEQFHSPTGHVQNVARTFALSFDRLNTNDAEDIFARSLLTHVCYLAPGEIIPHSLICAVLSLPNNDLHNLLKIEDAIDRLTSLGLIDREDEDSIRLHRLICSFMRYINPDYKAQEQVELAILTVMDIFHQQGLIQEFLRYQPHIKAVTDAAVQHHDSLGARLSFSISHHLRAVAEFTDAQKYCEQALNIHESSDGEKSFSAEILNTLGSIHQDQSNYDPARSCFKRAFTIRASLLGLNHPDTITSLNCLAMVINRQGDLITARPLYRRVLALRERLLEPDHPDVAFSCNALGMLLKDLGDYEAAVPLLKRALKIREQKLGETHVRTMDSLRNLAVVLYLQGEIKSAFDVCKRALILREQVLGSEHPDTAQLRSDFANILADTGEVILAISLMEDALNIQRRNLGPRHLKVAISLMNLGKIHARINNFGKAYKLYKQALEIQSERLSPYHPDIATTFFYISELQEAQNGFVIARKWYKKTLSLFLKTTHTHPLAKKCYSKLLNN
jgi:tetratricopeptide (TPR) repeat protein